MRIGELITGDNNLQILLTWLTDRTAYFNYSCRVSSSGTTRTFTSPNVGLSEGELRDLSTCGGQIKVNKIYFSRVAKIGIEPITIGKTQENNFTFSIGIEKRIDALKLTPEEANDRIAELDKTIAEWKNVTENLRDVIKVGNLACLATSAVLNVKNLYFGADGEASARNYAMTRTGGWNDICANAVANKQYSSLDKCLSANENAINSEINGIQTGMSDFNAYYKTYQDASKSSNQDNEVNNNLAFTNMVSGFKDNSNNYKDIALVDSNGNKVDKIGDKTPSEIISGINASKGDIQESEFRDLWMAVNAMKSGTDTRNASAKQAYNILSQIKSREEARAAYSSSDSVINGLQSIPINSQRSEEWTYNGKIWNSETKSQFKLGENVSIESNAKIAIVGASLFVLTGSGNTFTPTNVYQVTGSGDSRALSAINDPKEKNSLLGKYKFE
jgi:hypothetical protein